MPDLEIKGYYQGSLIEWPGLLVDSLFLAGCNYRCPFCHNPELIDTKSVPSLDVNDVLEELDNRKKTNWLDGVSITGGEPTLSKRLPEFLGILKKLGLKTKIDTNGSHPEVIQTLIDDGLLDYIAMDVKAVPEKYDKAIGVKAKLEKIKETISVIINSNIDHEFRTTIVPTIIDPKADLPKIAEMIEGAKRFYLQQFRPLKCLDKSFEKIRPYSLTLLEEICEQLKPFFEVCEIR